MLWEEKLTLVEVISSLVSLSFFMEQIIKINGQSVRCLLAVVRWFQSHPSRHLLGAPVELWYKDLFELEGAATFVPVKRLHGRLPNAEITLYNSLKA